MTCYSQISAVSYTITSLSSNLTQYNADVERLKQARTRLVNKQDEMNQSLMRVISPVITGEVWRGNRREIFYDVHKLNIRDTYLKIPRTQVEDIIIKLDRRISHLDTSISDAESSIRSKRSQLSTLYEQLRRERIANGHSY